MSAVTTSPDISVEQGPSRLTGTLPRTTVSVGVLAAAVTTAGAVALRAAGVPLAVHGKIPLAGSPRSPSSPPSSEGCFSPC